MKRMLRICSVVLMLMLLLTACAETVDPEAQQPTVAPTAQSDEPDIIVGVPTEDTLILDTPEPTPEPTPAPTEEPTAEPTLSFMPYREGDITDHFPNYDTGVDADYSYQSDELRIAITVHDTEISYQCYYVADIWIRTIDQFRTQFSQSEFNKPTEDGDSLAKRENAIFAVNGSYNQGLTFHAGKLYKNVRENKGWNSCATCVIYKDGTMKSFNLSKEKFNIKTEMEKGAWHAWQFGPILIRDSEIDEQATKYQIGWKARNMLGYYEPGHYVIVTCDAGRDDARGMHEFEMSKLMKELGVKEAFNLDGGTSAVMVFMGKVINRPTMRNDNGTMVAGRPLKDMLLFGEYDENGVSADLSTFTADKFLGE